MASGRIVQRDRTDDRRWRRGLFSETAPMTIVYAGLFLTAAFGGLVAKGLCAYAANDGPARLRLFLDWVRRLFQLF
jgi:hypothetical protein